MQNMICKNIKSIQNEVLVVGFNGRNKLCSFHFFDHVNKNMKLCKNSQFIGGIRTELLRICVKNSFNFSDNLISFCFFL